MTRPSACRRGYGRTWQKIAAAAIAGQPWCSDCGSRSDLTGDHEIPVSAGGLSTRGNLGIRCRSCNARKGNRPAARTQLTLDSLRATR